VKSERGWRELGRENGMVRVPPQNEHRTQNTEHCKCASMLRFFLTYEKTSYDSHRVKKISLSEGLDRLERSNMQGELCTHLSRNRCISWSLNVVPAVTTIVLWLVASLDDVVQAAVMVWTKDSRNAFGISLGFSVLCCASFETVSPYFLF
jgi:hypothetical protein